jgi:hypothetical protein
MKVRVALFLYVALLCGSNATSAHHATAADYDISKTIAHKGTITRVDWSNPHIHVYIDVKDSGHLEHWAVEFPSPGGTIVAGLSRQLLMPGTVLEFEGYPAKPNFHPDLHKWGAGSSETLAERFACATAVTLADGSHVGFVVGI